MPYATEADIVAIYGAEYLAGLMPDDVDQAAAAATALEQAGGEIDLYLSKRYQLPLAAVPVGLKTAAIDIACYRLAVTHDRLTEELKDRAKAARELVKDIGNGRAGLGAAEPQVGGAGEAAGDASAAFFARPKLWGRNQ